MPLWKRRKKKVLAETTGTGILCAAVIVFALTREQRSHKVDAYYQLLVQAQEYEALNTYEDSILSYETAIMGRLSGKSGIILSAG